MMRVLVPSDLGSVLVLGTLDEIVTAAEGGSAYQN